MEQKLVENDHLKMTAGVDVHAVSYVDDMVGGSKQPVVPATVVDEMVAGGAGSILGTHAVGDKCCSYEDCERPRDGSAYHRIDSRYPPSSLLLLLDILSFFCAVALCCVLPPADSHRLLAGARRGKRTGASTTGGSSARRAIYISSGGVPWFDRGIGIVLCKSTRCGARIPSARTLHNLLASIR